MFMWAENVFLGGGTNTEHGCQAGTREGRRESEIHLLDIGDGLNERAMGLGKVRECDTQEREASPNWAIEAERWSNESTL